MYENYKDKWTKQGNEQAGQLVQSGKQEIRESSPFRIVGRANMTGGVMPA
jgi:hypothetical protein